MNLSAPAVIPNPDPMAEILFPVRLACVDAGSNAIRYVAAEFTSPTQSVILAQDRAPVRLGHGVFLNGRLSRNAMDDAVVALAGFRSDMETREISRYRAVATSAVRESTNGDDFLARVRSETELSLEPISGSEEARLVHLAIRNRMPLGEQPWLLVDLGGGSVEVSLVDDRGMLWSESHTMGSVRLLEELSGTDEDPGRFRRVLTEYISTLRVPTFTRQHLPAGFIATGGNIESLAKLSDAPPDGNGVPVLELSQLRQAIEVLARLPYRQRVEELGLREDRADVILPAALVYERLAVLVGMDRIHVPGVGVKEGVLLDLVDDVAGHPTHEARRAREVFDGAVSLGRRYLFDEAHSVHVANLAGSLFDQLTAVHKLAAGDRHVLVAAGLLHDIGSFVSRKKHHRHSCYLIGHSEIPGLSPRETLLAAVVARYHRKGEPSPHHEEFSRLDAAEQNRVVRLASILRVADALDREHLQAVQAVRVKRGRSHLLLEVETTLDLLLERYTFKRRAQLMSKTFGVKVKLKNPGHPA